jgi:CRP/FNR family transcriptional regulator, anaerobic regulatory protein
VPCNGKINLKAMAAKEQFIELLCNLYPLDAKMQQFIAAHFEMVTLPRKTVLHGPGKPGGFYFFVLEGLLRSFFNDDHKQVTTGFIESGDFYFVPSTGRFVNPVNEVLESCNKSVLAVIAMESIELLFWQHLEVNFIVRVLFERALQVRQQQFTLLHLKPFAKRAAGLKQLHPGLIKQANNSQLASFLNMSRETYTRVK